MNTTLLGRLEAQIARALSGAFLVNVAPIIRDVFGDGAGAATALKADELIRRVERMNGDLRAVRGVQRQLRGVIESLAEMGALDLNAEIARAVRLPRLRVSQVLADPSRIAIADAELYERAAATMLQEHLRSQTEDIRESVVRGLAAGETDRDIGRRLHDLGVGRIRAHADTIARTETTRYYSLGRLRSGEAAGDLIWGYRYVVIVDDRTTEVCSVIAGCAVSKAALRWVPPFHWNCRTTVVPLATEPARLKAIPAGWQPEPGFGDDPRAALFGMRRAA